MEKVLEKGIILHLWTLEEKVEESMKGLLPPYKFEEALEDHELVEAYEKELESLGWQKQTGGSYSLIFVHPLHPDMILKIYNGDQYVGFESDEFPTVYDSVVLKELAADDRIPELYASSKCGCLMSRLTGRNLKDLSDEERERLYPSLREQVIQYIQDCAEKGWYQRDLNLDNMLLANDGRLMFFDFNCAVRVDNEFPLDWEGQSPEQYCLSAWEMPMQNLGSRRRNIGY